MLPSSSQPNASSEQPQSQLYRLRLSSDVPYLTRLSLRWHPSVAGQGHVEAFR
jgi:hypothetical protein